MKYEMQVTVSLSAASEREAYYLVERQLQHAPGGNYRKSEVTFVDAEPIKAEPECADCGALLEPGTVDYALCLTCAAAEREAVER